MENCGVKCGYCSSMGHMKDKQWKIGKYGKALFVATNYLKVMVDDEEITLKQLNQLSGTKHDILPRP
jgi:hypothetical protein